MGPPDWIMVHESSQYQHHLLKGLSQWALSQEVLTERRNGAEAVASRGWSPSTLPQPLGSDLPAMLVSCEDEKVVETPQKGMARKTGEVARVDREIANNLPNEVVEVIEVPKPLLIENRVVVPRIVDRSVPTVVSQKLSPIFVESKEHVITVKLKEYEAEIIPVDIFLPRPVDRNILYAGAATVTETPVDVPLAHYNALVHKLNSERLKNSLVGRGEHLGYGESPCSSVLQQPLNEKLTDRAVTTSDNEQFDQSLWLNHMLVPSRTGAVPLLNDEINLVRPNSNLCMKDYDETKKYIANDADQAMCCRCHQRTSKVSAARSTGKRKSKK